MATKHMEFLNIGFQGDVVDVVVNGGMTRRNLFEIKKSTLLNEGKILTIQLFPKVYFQLELWSL